MAFPCLRDSLTWSDLDQALDLDAAARQRWLDDLQAHKPAVAAAVRAWLVELEEARQEHFLDEDMATALRAGEARQAEVVEEDVFRRLTSDGAGDVSPAHRIDQGRILIRLGRSTEALKVLQSAVEGTRQRHLDGWEATGNFMLGSAQLDLGHLDEASRLFDMAESYWSVKEPGNQRRSSPLRQRRAEFGTVEQAEALATEAVRLAERDAIDVEQSADLGEALLNLARARLKGHHPESARAPLERALRCLTNGLGPDHPLAQLAKNLLQARS